VAEHSLEREITALLQQGLEQTDVFHAVTVGGQSAGGAQETVQFLADLIANQGIAIRKIAAEIDQLRAGQ
jgi:hypothetical protein